MKLTDIEEACIRISSDYLHRHMVFPPPSLGSAWDMKKLLQSHSPRIWQPGSASSLYVKKLLAVLSQGRDLSWLTMPWVLGVKDNFFQTTRPQEVTVLTGIDPWVPPQKFAQCLLILEDRLIAYQLTSQWRFYFRDSVQASPSCWTTMLNRKLSTFQLKNRTQT